MGSSTGLITIVVITLYVWTRLNIECLGSDVKFGLKVVNKLQTTTEGSKSLKMGEQFFVYARNYHNVCGAEYAVLTRSGLS